MAPETGPRVKQKISAKTTALQVTLLATSTVNVYRTCAVALSARRPGCSYAPRSAAILNGLSGGACRVTSTRPKPMNGGKRVKDQRTIVNQVAGRVAAYVRQSALLAEQG